MLKLSPNQIIKISSESKLKRRIYLNLKNVFSDHRQQSVITIDERFIKRIVDLKKHITRRFRLSQPFYLVNNEGYYLHPLESIDLLRDEEIVRLNLKDNEINQTETVSNDNVEIIENPKKRKADDDLTETNTKCIKMVTNRLTNHGTEQSTSQERQRLSNSLRHSKQRLSNPNLSSDKPQILTLNDVIDLSTVHPRKCVSEQFRKKRSVKNSTTPEKNKTVQEINLLDTNKRSGKGIVILKNVLISPAKKKLEDPTETNSKTQLKNRVDQMETQECVDLSEDVQNDEECIDVDGKNGNLDNTNEVSKTMFTSWRENDTKDLSQTKMVSWTDTNETLNKTENTTIKKDLEMSKTMMASWTDQDETLNKTNEKKKKKRNLYNSHVLSGVGCVLDQLRNESPDLTVKKNGESSKKAEETEKSKDNNDEETINKNTETLDEPQNIAKNNVTLRDKSKTSETLLENMDLDSFLKNKSETNEMNTSNDGFDESLNNTSTEVFDRPDFVTKRRRNRKRHSKKKEDLDDTSTTLTNTSVEFRPPKTKATPKIHKRFTDDETDKICESDTSVSMDVSNDEKSMNVTPDVGNYSQFLHSTPYQISNKMSVIPEETFVHPLCKFIENSKTFTGKPKINDKILFKKLKLDENYTPIVSDFIYGKIIKISDNGDVQIKILKGQNELKDPEGKFSLLDETEIDETDSSILETKWSLLLDTRLINDKN